MRLLAYIPDACIDPALQVSGQVRDQLSKAMAAGLQPAPLPKGVSRQTIDLPDAKQLAYVQRLAAKLDIAQGRIVGGLLHALRMSTAAEQSGPSNPGLDGLRPGQAGVLTELAPLMANGKITLAELGTGAGKSRLIAFACRHALALRDKGKTPSLPSPEPGLPDYIAQHVERASAVHRERYPPKQPGRCVIVAAPSIENVAHLCAEWSAVRSAVDPEQRLSLGVVLGRSQFVDSLALATLIEDFEGDTQPIEAWVKAGMPAGKTAATAAMLNACPQLRGLVDDLVAVADPDFPAVDAALDEDSESDDAAVYRALRDKAMVSDVVITTHAFVCLDSMRLTVEGTQGLLPAACALLVDEAHEFEGAQSAMAARTMSFARMLATLRTTDWSGTRQATGVEKLIALASKAQSALQTVPNETQLPISAEDSPLVFAVWSAAQAQLEALRTALAAFTAKSAGRVKDGAIPPGQRRARAYIAQCARALEMTTESHRGYVMSSPQRRQISLAMGPNSVARYLAARWAVSPTVVLLSGTLLQYGQGGARIGTTALELAIPQGRAAMTASYHPPWLTSTPVVHVPSSENFHRFMPPTASDVNDLSLAAWLHECARFINGTVARNARGGTLILMTGYERAEALSEALLKIAPSLAERLITQSRMNKVAACASLFKRLHSQGLRPIWIATGAAWTGLDLRDSTVTDDRAHEDRLLTDLVLPALPFGTDQSSTHRSRKKALGFGVEIQKAFRKFRQALGRLVRREGLVDRHIWLLDGRLVHPAATTYIGDMRLWITRYAHVQRIDDRPSP